MVKVLVTQARGPGSSEPMEMPGEHDGPAVIPASETRDKDPWSKLLGETSYTSRLWVGLRDSTSKSQ